MRKKKLFSESSYRSQMVKNKAVVNKAVFLFKRKTTLVVADKRGSFVISVIVREQVIDYLRVFRSYACSMSLVATIFWPMYTCALQTSFKAPLKRTGYRQVNFSCVETHFVTPIVVRFNYVVD